MKQRSEHVKAGLTAFLTVGAILVFYDTLFGRHWLLDVWKQLMTAVRPILYGAFMAYLLAPVVNFFEDRLFSTQVRKARERGRFTAPAARGGSMLLTWLLVCLMIYLLASVLLPELYKSLLQLMSNVENYYNTIAGWVEALLATYPDVEDLVAQQLNAYYRDINSWLSANDVAGWLQKALSQAQTGMGAAIGAQMATGEHTVLVTGDGSFGMNLAEMATAVTNQVPLVILLLNNRALGMVRQWQELFFEKHYSNTILERKTDFVKLAEAFGAQGEAVNTLEDLDAALKRAFEVQGPYLIDCAIGQEELVLPMLPPGGSMDDIIVKVGE